MKPVEADEPAFDLCVACRARLPAGAVFMSQEAAADFLESCAECSAKLLALVEPVAVTR